MSYAEVTELPAGSRFYKCALQVNPYQYLARHGKVSDFADEEAYNAAMVDACLRNGIEVVGVADHYRIKPAQSLIEALKNARIVVFPGFEAVTKDGVHFLVLFDPSTTLESVQGYIHECGIHGDAEDSPLGNKDAIELLEASQGWNAQVIAAHSTQSGGLFDKLSGKSRANVFKHPLLNACAIPAARDNIPDFNIRQILDNKDPAHQRERKIAVINAADVNSPTGFENSSSATFIRMDAPRIEGLRHALLDYESRIRLSSDDAPVSHPEILGLEIESERFLKGLRVRFNEGLNVLIGGRGAGKSALIECLRYVLDVKPLGSEAAVTHKAIIEKVARSGTKITLHVQTYKPDARRYRIERVVSQVGIKVYDEHDIETNFGVSDLLGAVSVYGQSELAELARDHTKLTELLGRFVVSDSLLDEEIDKVSDRLSDSRTKLIEMTEEVVAIQERQSPLASTLATLARYKESGVEERLSEQAAVVKSESLVTLARERIQPISNLAESLRSETPIPKSELDDENIADATAPESVKLLRSTLLALDSAISKTLDDLELALTSAQAQIDMADAGVFEARLSVADAFEATLRDLQKDNVDGAEFIRLREQVAKLQPLSNQIERIEQQAEETRSKRADDLSRWRELTEQKVKRLEDTAKRVSKSLEGGLRVTVVRGQDRRNLTALIARLGGRLHETQTELLRATELDVARLANSCREGPDAVERDFRFTSLQAKRLCEAGEEFFMELEQTELLPKTRIEFNIAVNKKGPPQWKELSDLSVGQKSTALLYLLMLDSDGPLILDQPEDNLDNRFVTKSVVPMIRGEKRRRQLIFATHNANIPVLGDAEQIVSIDADGEADRGRIRLEPAQMGSIDAPLVAKEVREILEGGQEAFEDRRVRYGF